MTVTEISTLMTDKQGAGYICVNKALMHNLGNDAAIVYAELVRSYLYYEKQGTLTDDGYFFCTVESLQENCNVSKAQQNKIFKSLAEKGLVKLDYRGLPKRRYIALIADEAAVNAIFSLPEKQEKQKEKMPEEIREKYSKDFDTEIFKKQINKAAKNLGKTAEMAERVYELYMSFFGYFGCPDTFLSNKSIENAIKRIEELYAESSWFVLDDDSFAECCEAYSEVNVEGKGYTRSLNNMLSSGMLEILEVRTK